MCDQLPNTVPNLLLTRAVETAIGVPKRESVFLNKAVTSFFLTEAIAKVRAVVGMFAQLWIVRVLVDGRNKVHRRIWEGNDGD